MESVAGRGRRGRKSRVLGAPTVVTAEEFAAMELDAKAELIKGLIPLGLMAVASPPLRQQRATARQESKSFQQRSS